MYLHHLQLHTNQLDELHHFYRETLGFHIESAAPQAFSLRAGHSRATFHLSEASHYYHFAFNIPSFQVSDALDWLEARVIVLSDSDQQVIDFSNWNAKAVYFKDPAGNIVEFIARKNLQIRTKRPFSVASIMGISEIGLPVREVASAYTQLHRQTGIEKYWGDFKRFCATGDEHGLFIIVDEAAKTWYPTDQRARPAPLDLEFSQGGQLYRLQYDGEQLTIDEQ